MSGATPSRKFFIAVDANASSLDALAEAVRLRHADDFLSVVNFVEYGKTAEDVSDTPSRRLMERFELYLTPRIAHSHWEAVQRTLPIDTTVRRGIVDAVNTGGYAYLVAGYNHPRSPDEVPSFLHSATDPCVRRARADIIIVKERLPDDIPLVFVVGVDGSTTGDRSFDTAVYFAAAHTKPVTIHVVHVYDGEIESGLPLHYQSEAIEKRYASKTSETVIYANVPRKPSSPLADTLIEYCESVSGTHLFVGVDGMTALTQCKEVIGSVSDRCAKLSKCPVVLVHPAVVPTTKK